MRSAGFPSAGVTFWETDGTAYVLVHWRVASNDALAAEKERISEVVWRTAKYRLEGIRLEPRGIGANPEFVPRADLVARFGERDPALDEHGLGLGWAPWALGGTALAGVALTAVVVVDRRRRGSSPGAPA